MKTIDEPTKLNNVQTHLLNMFRFNKKKKELDNLKAFLAKYYMELADNESEKIWKRDKMTQAKLKKEASIHKRTPYK